jgi:GWxTD domain-containing protein
MNALGWTLVHFLWEGAALALFLMLFGRATTRVRYAAACAALAAMPVAFAITLYRMWPADLAMAHFRIPLGQGIAAPLTGGSPEWSAGPNSLWTWLVAFWMAGVAVFYLRSLGGWVAARRLRGTGVAAASGEWQARFAELRARVGVNRAVALMESCLTEVPVVIGYVRPVILLPAGLATGLSTDQVEALLMHELAHIRRHDYLVNLLQSAIEGLLFYHPAVWWVSHVIRTEREHCCDDVVVDLRGDARGYAGALAALETLRAPEPMLAASGGSLVRRLLRQPEGPQGSPATAIAALLLLTGASAMLSGWQQTAPPPPRPRPPAAEQKQGQPMEQRARRAAKGRKELETPYEKWLEEDVVYIIAKEERDAFENLASNEEKEHFIEQFWQRRDPTPGTGENEMKEEHYRRIGYSNEHFSTDDAAGWRTDRGRAYIIYGPSDEKEVHPSEGTEQWLYHHIDGMGDNVIFEFKDGRLVKAHDAANKVRAMKHDGPFADHIDRNGDLVFVGQKVGSVTVGAEGGVVLRASTGAAAGQRSNVFARIATRNRQMVTSMEDVVQGPSWSKQTKLAPGVYRLNLVSKNLATGAIATDELQFVVK